jgi:hypothetical protein
VTVGPVVECPAGVDGNINVLDLVDLLLQFDTTGP